MKEITLLNAATAFYDYTPGLPPHEAGAISFTPLQGGLINRSWLVQSELKVPFLLQQINTHVFPSPEDVQHNYITISQYAEYEFTGLRLPYPKYLNERDSLYIDKQGNYWRAFEFIDNAYSVSIAKKPSQAKATAKTFAKFTAAFEEFNTELLKIVIPDFHNLSFRYRQLQESLNSAMYERMPKALTLAEELKNRERYIHFYELITESPENFPQRVMHHDAKIANVLFSKKNGKVICPVDFDTVMPGYFFSDLGDMVRSMACSVDENSTDFDRIKIRSTFYKAIIDGYLSVMSKYLTDAEKKYIHYGGLLMIYMQALRYLSDYLEGDIYYSTAYPEQNFNRAKNQLVLLQRLEEFLEKEYNIKV